MVPALVTLERNATADAGTRRRGRPQAEVEKMLPLWDMGGVPYLGYRLVLAARMFERRITEMLVASQSGMTLPEWRVLALLGVMPNATVRMLADAAAVDRAEVSRATRKLSERALVRRIENPADMRSPMFDLTPEGSIELNRVAMPQIDHIRRVVAHLDQDDLDAADRMLWAMTTGCVKPDED